MDIKELLHRRLEYLKLAVIPRSRKFLFATANVLCNGVSEKRQRTRRLDQASRSLIHTLARVARIKENFKTSTSFHKSAV